MQMRLDRNRLRIMREMAADGLSQPKKKKMMSRRMPLTELIFLPQQPGYRKSMNP